MNRCVCVCGGGGVGLIYTPPLALTLKLFGTAGEPSSILDFHRESDESDEVTKLATFFSAAVKLFPSIVSRAGFYSKKM